MSEESDPIEQRLRAMGPAEVSVRMMQRLEAAEPGRIRWLRWAVPLAAAAVWVLAMQIPRGPERMAVAEATPGLSAVRVYAPVAERSYLVGVRDLGIVGAAAEQPVRLMHYSWIDDTTFHGDDGRSTLRRARTREQIVPVSLEVF